MMKRVLSILLALALALGLAMPAVLAAAPAAPCDCGVVPEILVPGWGHTIYLNEGTPEERPARFVNTDDVALGVGELLKDFSLAVLRLDWSYVAQGVGALLYSIFSETRLDAEGNSVLPISHHWQVDPAQDHKEQPEYFFAYDWRMDPMDAGRQLNDFIQAVKAQTGHSKVAIFGESQGACIAMAYLAQFGAGDLEAFVLGVGAFGGLTLVGDLFRGKAHLESKAVANYLADMVQDDTGMFAFFLNALQCLGVLDAVIRPIEYGVLPHIQRQIFDETLLPLFGFLPAIWTFVPPEDYAEAKAYFFDGREAEYETLIRTIDDYHDTVQVNANQLLLDAQADGVRVALLAGYNKAAMPVTPRWDYQSDGLIDTARSSGGATTAPYGQTLPRTEGKYLSPDRMIDASTCLLPDTTWFFKNNSHTTEAMQELRHWFIQGEAGQTVFSDPRYPQFMQNVDGKGVPLV
ncbi:MAG: lysophospholipase [Oscillospiraceae bacterium]|jgi:pimeloyl-ACP methyl ester carboxylesterase|nr:lysophospholipase [Oscillospiraceae bacterium]